ncbi:hypothetical protein [Helicobacter rodentium]|uniref:hypothetical protein n=1 Tax=Helicobacter rodentium TaxID=59617 RepID=UPI0023F51FCC|nr:hypothetical protein [Helicobacter rodentium]
MNLESYLEYNHSIIAKSKHSEKRSNLQCETLPVKIPLLFALFYIIDCHELRRDSRKDGAVSALGLQDYRLLCFQSFLAINRRFAFVIRRMRKKLWRSIVGALFYPRINPLNNILW